MPEEKIPTPETPVTPVVETPAAPVTPPEPPAPAPTPEEIAAEATDFIQAAFGNGKPKAIAVPPEPEPAPDPAPEPAPAPPAEPKKKPIVVKKKPEASLEEIETIARRVAAEEREAAQVPPPPPVEPDQTLADLTDENKETLEVLTEMESANPARYAGISQNVRKFWKAEDDYKARWQTQNPDETFNADDPAHNAFYRKNEPTYTPADFKLASRSIIAKAAAATAKEELRKEWEPRFKTMDAEKARRDAAPEIQEAVNQAVVGVFAGVPDFEKLIDDGNGNYALTKEAVTKMSEINKPIHRFVSEEAETMMSVIGELEQLTRLAEHHTFNPSMPKKLGSNRVIYPHAIINDTIHELEESLSRAPKADRIDLGRDFITNAERAQRVQAIRSSNAPSEARSRQLAALNATTWSISPEHVRDRLLKQSKARVADVVKEFSIYTKVPPAPGSAESGKATTPAEHAKAAGKAGLPKGTATSSVSDTSNNASRLNGPVTKESEEFATAAFY